MSLLFQGSNQPTLGVEIELQMIDPETLDLIPEAEKLLSVCKQKGLKRIKAEIHQSMIEIDTEISKDVKECYGFLKKRLQELNTIAESLDIQIGTTGTHPFQRWADRRISKHDRYQDLHEKFQWLARRMNVYGLHVHVGVSSGERVLAISQLLVPYLPHLLALSASSPFWQGIDTGMQSSRINIIESFPFAGLPARFKCWDEFEHYYHTLHQVGVIGSLKDIYWYIRPNLSYGTIEFRICDVMPTLKETMSVVALIQCLVVWADQNLENKFWKTEYDWLAPENQWIAARDGLEGLIITDLNGKREKISEEILKLIDQLTPIAKSLNCYEELIYLDKMIIYGNGAQRQRAIYQETESLKHVVHSTIHAFKESFQD